MNAHHAPRADRLRVLTLNLWHDATEAETRVQSAADMITGVDADVVALQEVARRDGRSVARALADLTGLAVVGEGPFVVPCTDGASGTAVLSRLPMTRPATTHQLPGRSHNGGRVGAVTGYVRTAAGREAQVTSVHAAHGGGIEAVRLDQALYLDRELATGVSADTTSELRILAGDFNTTPDGDVHRFLTGRGVDDGWSTLWLDAWDVAGSGPGHTSTADNPWARQVAAHAGIADPALLPDRRIDWVLVHGWRWGRPGMPLAARVVGQEGTEAVAPSDHYGVVVDFWDPAI